MKIETTRFGPIEISEDRVIQFPRGLYGMEAVRAFCLLPSDEQGRFQWLQAVADPAIALVVTDPFLFFDGYEVEISDPDTEFLQATAASDLTLYTSVTVAADRREIFTNLLGPLVINHRAGRGAQLIQDASRYTTRHLISAGRRPAGSPTALEGESRHDVAEPMTLVSRACHPSPV